jgi:predicted Fe-Mo cluster-binding NifX family protein
MKIALAGRKDSTRISHFGRADFFRIYEGHNGGYLLQEIRFNKNAPGNGAGHDLEALGKTVELIGDCTAVVASSIGPGAQGMLVHRRIFPFEREGEGSDGIQRALQAVQGRLGKIHAQYSHFYDYQI